MTNHSPARQRERLPPPRHSGALWALRSDGLSPRHAVTNRHRRPVMRARRAPCWKAYRGFMTLDPARDLFADAQSFPSLFDNDATPNDRSTAESASASAVPVSEDAAMAVAAPSPATDALVSAAPLRTPVGAPDPGATEGAQDPGATEGAQDPGATEGAPEPAHAATNGESGS